MSDNTRTTGSEGSTHRAGAFDIRTLIALLIGIYGVVLVLTGILGTDADALAKSDGLNINLWAGLGMIVAAALFAVWARLRPVVVPEDPASGAAELDRGEPST